MKKRFIFVNSHPIQYFAPLYQQMELDEKIEIEVIYCSDQGVSKKKDKQFGQVFKWNIPLLEGYKYCFFRNYAPRPNLYGFWGLQNWGIIWHLLRAPKSILVINGWQFFIYIVAIVVGRLAGHTVCLRGESPLSRELIGSSRKKWLKKLLLSKFLFQLPHYFLYIGKQNKAFYQYMGIQESRLIFSPYSVDNHRFQTYYPEDDFVKKEIRAKLGLPLSESIVLYSGKFIDKKRPLDLLRAWGKIKKNAATLVFVGDGILRQEMEEYIDQHMLTNVLIAGFINQAEIPLYYAAADLYVMLSDTDETWGLSTNEAMNLRLPIIISDTIGCASDLVDEGKNGFQFKHGDIEDLRYKLQKILENAAFRKSAGQRSFEIVNEYSYDNIIKNLLSIPQ